MLIDVVYSTRKALIGFQVMGLVVASPNTLVTPLDARRCETRTAEAW